MLRGVPARLRVGVAALLAAVTVTSVTHAQSRVPLVAILEPGPASGPPGGVPHFKHALADLGWVEGRTVRFETRYSDWRPDRMTEMARELVALQPDILYTHSDRAVRTAMGATSSIPIVVGAIADLPATGAVRSLARPGGNVTGVSHAQHELDRKRLEVLKDAVPSVERIAYLFETAALSEAALRVLEETARALGVRLQRFGIDKPDQIPTTFAALTKEQVQGVLVQDSVFLSRNAERVTALALTHRLPTVSQIPRFAERGGLLQYGADVHEMFRRSAGHVDKILRGAKPADLPIEEPTRVDLIVNVKTAKALGLRIPPAMIIRADRVIE